MSYFDTIFKVIYELFYKDVDDGDIYTTAIIFLLIIFNITSLTFFIQAFTGRIIDNYILFYALFSGVLILILYKRYIYSNNYKKVLSKQNISTKRELHLSIAYVVLSIITLIIAYRLNSNFLK